MDTSATEAQAPTVTATTPAPETSAPAPVAPAPQTVEEQRNALEASLADPNWKPEASATPATEPQQPATTEPQAPEVPAAVEPTAPAGDQPQGDEPVQPSADDEPAELPERFRFHDQADRLFATLRKQGVPAHEAAARAYGAAPAQEPQAPAEPQQPQVDTLEQAKAELAEITGKLATASEGEQFYSPDIEKLNERRAELLAEVKVEERMRKRDQRTAQEQQQQATVRTEQAQAAAVADARKAYPSIATVGSALNAEAHRLITEELQGSVLLAREDAPVKVAELAARNVAATLAAKNKTTFEAEFAKLQATAAAPVKPATPAPAAKPAAETRKAVPVVASGALGTRTPDQPKTDGEKFSEVTKITDPRAQKEALDRLLYEPAA